MQKLVTVRSLLLFGAFVIAAFTLTIASGKAADPTFNANKEVVMPVAGINFQNINPAIRMGAAWGSRGNGSHGTFGTFPANFTTPIHTHSGAYHAVVIEGVMTNPFGKSGETNPANMAPGSYWYVPAGMPHATACVSDVPCRFYFHAESAFDFQPVGG